MRRHRWIAPVALLGLATILAAQLGPNRYRIEEDLTRHATAALAAAGQPHTRVTFEGQEALVVVGSPAEATRAEAVVSAVAGVRTVRIRVTTPDRTPATTAPATAAPTTSAPEPTAPTPDAPAPSAATPSATTPPTTTPSAPEPGPRETEETGPRETGSDGTARKRLATVPALTFEADGARLTPQARRALPRIAAILRDHPEITILLAGHTDTLGPADANLALSWARADSVRAALRQHGVADERMTAIGHGETRPKAPDDTPARRAANRRVEVSITGR